jgi:hypothetical protein
LAWLGVTFNEGECNTRVDLGKYNRRTRPEAFKERSQLIGQSDALSHQVRSGAYHRPQTADLITLPRQHTESMPIGAQQIRQQIGIPSIALPPDALYLGREAFVANRRRHFRHRSLSVVLGPTVGSS